MEGPNFPNLQSEVPQTTESGSLLTIQEASGRIKRNGLQHNFNAAHFSYILTKKAK